MARVTPAEVFPPGEFIREELEERGWTQRDLAEIMGRTTTTINQIIMGKRAVTPETAQELAEAFGTSAELWLNLESSYRLSLVSRTSGEVRRRAQLFNRRRGWRTG